MAWYSWGYPPLCFSCIDSPRPRTFSLSTPASLGVSIKASPNYANHRQYQRWYRLTGVVDQSSKPNSCRPLPPPMLPSSSHALPLSPLSSAHICICMDRWLGREMSYTNPILTPPIERWWGADLQQDHASSASNLVFFFSSAKNCNSWVLTMMLEPWSRLGLKSSPTDCTFH